MKKEKHVMEQIVEFEGQIVGNMGRNGLCMRKKLKGEDKRSYYMFS